MYSRYKNNENIIESAQHLSVIALKSLQATLLCAVNGIATKKLWQQYENVFKALDNFKLWSNDIPDDDKILPFIFKYISKMLALFKESQYVHDGEKSTRVKNCVSDFIGASLYYSLTFSEPSREAYHDLKIQFDSLNVLQNNTVINHNNNINVKKRLPPTEGLIFPVLKKQNCTSDIRKKIDSVLDYLCSDLSVQKCRIDADKIFDEYNDFLNQFFSDHWAELAEMDLKDCLIKLLCEKTRLGISWFDIIVDNTLKEELIQRAKKELRLKIRFSDDRLQTPELLTQNNNDNNTVTETTPTSHREVDTTINSSLNINQSIDNNLNYQNPTANNTPTQQHPAEPSSWTNYTFSMGGNLMSGGRVKEGKKNPRPIPGEPCFSGKHSVFKVQKGSNPNPRIPEKN